MKKKVLIGSGVVLLLIIIIVLIVGLFKDNNVNNGKINITIKALDNLKISSDAVNYDNVIDNEKLDVSSSVYKNRNQLPNVLYRMSSIGSITDGNLDIFYETVDSEKKDYFLSSEKQKDEKCNNDACNNHYIVYDLFFSTDMPETIALSPNSYVKQKDDNGMENAIRVGFIVEGTTNSKDLNDVYNLGAGIKTIIWEPNKDMHTKEAINFTKDIYDEDLEDDKLYYRGINSNFNKINIKDVKDSNKFSNVSSTIRTEKEIEEKQNLFTIQQGLTKIKVYIWFEGGDRDSLFETKVSNLDINLEFMKA